MRRFLALALLSCACTTQQSEDPAPSGPYRAAPALAAGEAPASLALAGFDGDTKLDLVVANSAGNSLFVFRGDGQGRFEKLVDLPTGKEPVSVTAGDFDSDGSADIASCNREADTAQVHFNQGGAKFAAPLELAADARPSHVVARDLNKDGHVDLVVTNADGNSLSVFISDGKGGFAPRADYPAGTNPVRATLVDLDGDGALDAVTATRVVPPTVGVLLGDGKGGFADVVKYKASNRPGVVFPIAPLAITSGDVNGDGHADVVVGNRGLDILDGEVWLLAGDGSGTLALPAELPGVVVLAPAFIELVDFDGDGDLDIVEADHDPSLAAVVAAISGSGFSVCIDHNDGKGSFEHAACPGTGDYPHEVATGDLNEDGKLDLATANSGTNDVTVQLASW